ncbi:MAG: hypothetical protein QNK23_16740 [Crocinitomicaceae bacterium]|nr:hypothetical protein [Crocinitomicaceae bacterium]
MIKNPQQPHRLNALHAAILEVLKIQDQTVKMHLKEAKVIEKEPKGTIAKTWSWMKKLVNRRKSKEEERVHINVKTVNDNISIPVQSEHLDLVLMINTNTPEWICTRIKNDIANSADNGYVIRLSIEQQNAEHNSLNTLLSSTISSDNIHK